MCKEDYGWNPTTCICENGKYPGSIINNSVIRCDEIINAVGNVSTTMSTNFYKKKVRYNMDLYILHTVLLVIILLLIIALNCYHYKKHIFKQKNIATLTV